MLKTDIFDKQLIYKHKLCNYDCNYFEKMFNYYNKLKTRIILNRSGRLKPTKIIIIPNKRENIITESWFLFVNIDIVLIEMTIDQ